MLGLNPEEIISAIKTEKYIVNFPAEELERKST
jgi:hypothetical protein